MHHFLPVVVPADATETNGHGQHHPHVTIAEVTPQQRGDDDGNQNQGSAHGRCAGFDQMRFRAIAPHRLADLLGGQPADQAWSGNEGNDQRGHCRQHRAQGDIPEHIESPHVLCQPLRQHQQHYSPPSGAGTLMALATLSMRMKRDPLTRTMVSGVSSAVKASTSRSTCV
ncbi:MAG: hypothetical protein CAPSK01_003099 [Candidatus Accumulibacter vicinus]|uniref:Uncharacterized protein n=1 Tax=Candidatus Accumulibacter vicinus TaxID=2954382 RepID=A0A084XYW2_9PROT|nr:MAG: hypothetical protein CAPSK01_003099 [Candidatus Accumulibacter vicinus]